MRSFELAVLVEDAELDGRIGQRLARGLVGNRAADDAGALGERLAEQRAAEREAAVRSQRRLLVRIAQLAREPRHRALALGDHVAHCAWLAGLVLAKSVRFGRRPAPCRRRRGTKRSWPRRPACPGPPPRGWCAGSRHSATVSQICWSLSWFFHGGIMCCMWPFFVMSNNSCSERPAITSYCPSAAGFTPRPAALGPSPLPVVPWHGAQFWDQVAWPLSGFGGVTVRGGGGAAGVGILGQGGRDGQDG